jgi:DNA polymerase-3 subunit beta
VTEIVSNLPSSEVEIRVEEGTSQAEILCERAAFEILGLPADDFPRMPDSDSDVVCAVDAPLLRSMIRQTIFAVSTDETRQFLTGLHLVVDGSEIRLVATDGGRLALRTAQIDKSAAKKIEVIVPGKTMHELVRALGGEADAVTISAQDTQLVFSMGSLRFVTRLIGGQFPNYQQVIPKEFKQKIRVGTEQLRAAVRRVAITARDSATVVRLGTEGQTLKLQSNTPDVGRAHEEFDVVSEGEDIQAAFNARFLMDALAVLEADEVSFELTGPLSPGALRPIGATDYVYVLAPVRVYS